MDTLAAAVGSDTLARSIEEQFRSADLPLTQENINELKNAWDMAASLKEPEEGAVSYLVDNGLEPEIWNLYVAENSGAKVQNNDVPQELQEQMDKVIADAGLTVNDENRQKAQWLVSAGLPLTTDTLQQLVELDGISYPVTEDTFAQAAAAQLRRENPRCMRTWADRIRFMKKQIKCCRTGSRMQSGMPRQRIWQRENSWKRFACA